MKDQTIQDLVDEIAPILEGRMMGRVLQLSRLSLALDFRLRDGRLLFVSVDPSSPRLYLIERRVRDIEKKSSAPSQFLLTFRKHLGGAVLRSVTKDSADRIVRFRLAGKDELGNATDFTVVAQLTGKAANLLLVDSEGVVLDALRRARGEGQSPGHAYKPPPNPKTDVSGTPEFDRSGFSSLSEAADHYYSQLETEHDFKQRADSARALVRKEISQREKLRLRLSDDLVKHGDAEEHKRLGDLLLANASTASRSGSIVRVKDYYADGAPEIEIEVDENLSMQEAAARRFARYTKARSAAKQIAARLETIRHELAELKEREATLERIIEVRDFGALENITGAPKSSPIKKGIGKASSTNVPGARRYLSSDGYEILVGRASRDNDNLTFRIARPHDLWLHTSDYPGSHVVVRNPSRSEVPHRTIIEAAQLAAHFSQAKRDSKVDVHYTQRKFLSKPKGAAPGLVRMSSFRTITVEPGENVERS